MASSLSGTATFSLAAGYGKASDLSTLTDLINYTNSPTAYSFGTGNNQADLIFRDTRTLNGGESFDLNAGSIDDSFGDALVFVKVRLLFIKNRSTTTGTTTLTGDFLSGVATSPLVGSTSPTILIGPSGFLLLESPINGFAVTSTTSDGLTVTNSASFDYDIIILGCSA